MNLDSKFQEFVREQQYLKGVSPKTLLYYQAGWVAFRKAIKGDELTQSLPVDFVAYWKEAGIKHITINTYARPINTFLNWLYARSDIPSKIRIPRLKEENPTYKPFDEKALVRILRFKPKKDWERRLHTMLCLIMDTGLRIDEAMRTQRSKIDFDISSYLCWERAVRTGLFPSLMN